MKRKVINPGHKFDRLTVVREATRSGERLFECVCDCGKAGVYRLGNLSSGHTRSCGCLKGDHGLYKRDSYSAWKAMKGRCLPTSPDAPNYYDRGIRICPEWFDGALVFCEWAEANGYQKGLQLDRIDNNKGYSPDNCRFVTCSENNKNNRRSCWWFINGIRYDSSQDAANDYGVQKAAVRKWCDGESKPAHIKSAYRYSKYHSTAVA